jgi:predicted homoserine dehydrogenase-like protein
VFYGESLLQPVHGFKTNVIAYAKKDLKKGELLDGIGGFSCYGLIENIDGDDATGLPICMSEGARLLEDIPKDHRIKFSDVEQDKGNEGLRLFEAAQSSSFQKYDEIDLINPTPLPLP